MTDTKQRAPEQPELFTELAAPTTTREYSRREVVNRVKDRKPTQRDRVLWLLRNHDAVCASMFLEARIPRYGARLWELTHREGFYISRRWCTRPTHRHENPLYEWILEAMPSQGDLPEQAEVSPWQP